MSKTQTVEVKILGQKIVMKTGDMDPRLVQDVTSLVSGKIREVEKRLKGTLVPHQVALLAMMDLAAEYLGAKKRTEDFKEQVESCSQELFSLIEAELKG